MKIDHNVFGNNLYISDLVARETIDMINSILPTAQRDGALKFTMPGTNVVINVIHYVRK